MKEESKTSQVSFGIHAKEGELEVENKDAAPAPTAKEAKMDPF